MANLITMFSVIHALCGAFSKNLLRIAQICDVESEAQMLSLNPFAALVPWVLVDPGRDDHFLLSNTRTVLVAVLIFNGKKKSYEPSLFRLTWAADKYGLPTDCRHISVTSVDEGEPSVILGYIKAGHSATSSKRKRYIETLVFRFFFSAGDANIGGRFNQLPSDQQGLARKMCHVGEGCDESDIKSDMVFVPEFRLGREACLERIEEFCAPPTKEARLTLENKKLKTALDEQQAAIEAQRAEMAAMQAQMAAMMEMLKQNQNA